MIVFGILEELKRGFYERKDLQRCKMVKYSFEDSLSIIFSDTGLAQYSIEVKA